MLSVVACACGVTNLSAAPANGIVSPSNPASGRPRHSTIYITSVTSVGSHIPLVVRSYGGSLLAMSGTYIYGRQQIVETGTDLNVAAALINRDPSIMLVASHR